MADEAPALRPRRQGASAPALPAPPAEGADKPAAISSSLLWGVAAAVTVGVGCALLYAWGGRRAAARALEGRGVSDNVRAAVLRSVEAATAAGALHPLGAVPYAVRDGPVPFTVSFVDRAAFASKNASGAGSGGGARDAFASPEAPLVVGARWFPRHMVLLNKFPVAVGHLVVVTHSFEPQERALSRDDMLATWGVLSAVGGLAFFNAGQPAGASQPRKHVQVIPAWALEAVRPTRALDRDALALPAPLVRAGEGADAADWPAVPLLPLVLAEGRRAAAAAAAAAAPGAGEYPSFRLSFFDFPHACVLLPPALATTALATAADADAHDDVAAQLQLAGASGARLLHGVYMRLVRELGLLQDLDALPADRDLRSAPCRPHNLLLTQSFLLVVPRAREAWEDLGTNALGFAGLFLCTTPDKLARTVRVGPLQVLRACAAGEARA